MEATDSSVERLRAQLGASVLDHVDHAGMPAAGEQHQALRGLDHHRHVFGQIVFGSLTRCVAKLAAATPVALRMFAGHRTGEPDAREDLGKAGMLDELAAGRLILPARL